MFEAEYATGDIHRPCRTLLEYGGNGFDVSLSYIHTTTDLHPRRVSVLPTFSEIGHRTVGKFYG